MHVMPRQVQKHFLKIYINMGKSILFLIFACVNMSTKDGIFHKTMDDLWNFGFLFYFIFISLFILIRMLQVPHDLN